jgi:integrase
VANQPGAGTGLIGAAHGTFKPMLPVLIDTGMRISECCSLRWQNREADNTPDLAGGVVIIRRGKGKFSKRSIPMTPRVRASLERQRATTGNGSYVFLRGAGPKADSPCTPRWAWDQFDDCRRAIGLVGPVIHSCRHECASRLGEAGASAFVIQEILGHGDIRVSARYVHAEKEEMADAIAKMAAAVNL